MTQMRMTFCHIIDLLHGDNKIHIHIMYPKKKKKIRFKK